MMCNLIEIIPDFEIQIGNEIDPDLFNQVKELEKQRNLLLKKEISFSDYCEAVAIACDVDEYLNEVEKRVDLWL